MYRYHMHTPAKYTVQYMHGLRVYVIHTGTVRTVCIAVEFLDFYMCILRTAVIVLQLHLNIV